MLLLSVVVIVSAFYLANRYLAAQDITNNAKFATCLTQGTNHTVTLQDDQANPQHVNGKLCDTMTFTNKDNAIRLVAFGPHEDHQPYDGITEQALGPNQSLTITFNQLGTYHFHDHIGDVIQGDFTVTR